MSDQHPGVDDEVERALRLGLATASQTADRYARVRQDLARQAQHRSDQEFRQLAARYRAEGASATARLALVDRTEWWDRAAPAEIASMWQLAVQWQNEQPRASIATETIARQVHDRYGLDVRAPGVDVEAVHAAVLRVDAEQRDRAGRAGEHDDVATAVAAVVRAEQRDASLVPPAAEHQEMGAVQEQQSVDQAALLELEAEQYEGQAAEGGTASLTPEKLLALAADARAQAVLHRAEVAAPASQKVPGPPVSFDSAERREQTTAHLHDIGLGSDAVAVAMRADVAHARPASEAVTARTTVDRGAGPRGTARGVHRPDRGR